MLALVVLSQLAIDGAVVVGRVDGGTWSDAPTEARLDQTVELCAVVIARRGGRRVVLAPEGVERLVLAGRKVPRTEALTARSIRWVVIEPHGFRAEPAKNGATTSYYSNVSTDAKTFGRWLGYDEVGYFERPLSKTSMTIRPSIDSPDGQVPRIGTLRYRAILDLGDGHEVSSPGLEARDAYGILPSVHRVSIRTGDGFLGYLSAYLLVPEVFGSAGGGKNHQTERFTGADCADVMVGAMRRTGKKLAYTNVAGLTAYATAVTGVIVLDERGMPPQPITGIELGDLIRIDYGGALANHTPRGWDHVAALWEDRSDPNGPSKGKADGALDGFDLVIHMGHPRLVIEPLSEQSPATIDVLRWRK